MAEHKQAVVVGALDVIGRYIVARLLRAGRGLDSAARVLRGPMIDRERRRSCAPDDHQEPPHPGGTRRTEDPGRCSGVPSSSISDANCRQKTESLFTNTFKSILQQNLPTPDTLTLNARVLSARYSSKDIRRLSRFLVSWTKPQAIPTKIAIFQRLSGNLCSKPIAARAAFDQDQGFADRTCALRSEEHSLNSSHLGI